MRKKFSTAKLVGNVDNFCPPRVDFRREHGFRAKRGVTYALYPPRPVWKTRRSSKIVRFAQIFANRSSDKKRRRFFERVFGSLFFGRSSHPLRRRAQKGAVQGSDPVRSGDQKSRSARASRKPGHGRAPMPGEAPLSGVTFTGDKPFWDCKKPLLSLCSSSHGGCRCL